MFQIDLLSGVRISQLSAYEDEDEILLPLGRMGESWSFESQMAAGAVATGAVLIQVLVPFLRPR